MPMHIPLVCDVGLFSINHASINYEINFQTLQKPGKLSGSIDSKCISRMWCTRLNLQRPNPLTSRLSVTKGTLYLAICIRIYNIYIYMLILSYRSVAAFHYVLPCSPHSCELLVSRLAYASLGQAVEETESERADRTSVATIHHAILL